MKLLPKALHKPGSRMQKWAREMRAAPTRAEGAALAKMSEAGVQVVLQVPFHKYILDMVDVHHPVVYEIDGSDHRFKKKKAGDRKRDLQLKEAGVEVLRIKNTSALSGTRFIQEVLRARKRAEGRAIRSDVLKQLKEGAEAAGFPLRW